MKITSSSHYALPPYPCVGFTLRSYGSALRSFYNRRFFHFNFLIEPCCCGDCSISRTAPAGTAAAPAPPPAAAAPTAGSAALLHRATSAGGCGARWSRSGHVAPMPMPSLPQSALACQPPGPTRWPRTGCCAHGPRSWPRSRSWPIASWPSTATSPASPPTRTPPTCRRSRSQAPQTRPNHLPRCRAACPNSLSCESLKQGSALKYCLGCGLKLSVIQSPTLTDSWPASRGAVGLVAALALTMCPSELIAFLPDFNLFPSFFPLLYSSRGGQVTSPGPDMRAFEQQYNRESVLAVSVSLYPRANYSR